MPFSSITTQLSVSVSRHLHNFAFVYCFLLLMAIFQHIVYTFCNAILYANQCHLYCYCIKSTFWTYRPYVVRSAEAHFSFQSHWKSYQNPNVSFYWANILFSDKKIFSFSSDVLFLFSDPKCFDCSNIAVHSNSNELFALCCCVQSFDRLLKWC